MLLASLASVALAWTVPDGLRPDEVAVAMGACFPDVKELVSTGERLRFVDVGFEMRAIWVVASRSISIPQERCPAVRALPDVPDGLIRCFSLPKGGYQCKPIPGPRAAETVVQTVVAERRGALDTCLGGRKQVWTVHFTVGIDGMPRDLSLGTMGAIESAVIDCLSDEAGGWKFGHLGREVPVQLTVGG